MHPAAIGGRFRFQPTPVIAREAGAATAINIEVFNAYVGSSVLIGGPIIGSTEPHIFAEASGGLVILRLIVILVTGESRAR